jgi:ATP-dependent Clp protease ATP-binding subunit ClpA
MPSPRTKARNGTPAARSRLAQLGHDPKLGARPLRRTIEDVIVARLAERMAREPGWRDAVVSVATAGEPGDIHV